MSRPTLRLTREADAHIRAAFDWYLGQSPEAAERFLEAMDAAFEGIVRSPAHSPIVRARVRRSLLRGFPYAVYFEERAEEILVLAVFHGRRDPKLWKALGSGR